MNKNNPVTSGGEKNDIAVEHSQTKGGATPLFIGVRFVKILCKFCNSSNTIKRGKRKGIQRYFCKDCKRKFQFPKIILSYPCVECGELIINAKHTSKQFCDDCIKKHRHERLKVWKKKHPDKCKEYQQLKNIRKVLRSGKEPRTLITECILCGVDISNNPSALYCKECRPEIRLFQGWYQAEVIEGRDIVKRSLIKNCLICGKNISMLTGQDLYCHNCKPSRNFNDLGTVTFGEHMKRKRFNVPDFKAERKSINNQMIRCGLK